MAMIRMNDLIKRSDAIEAIEVVGWYHQNRNKDMVSGANDDEHQAWYKADDIYKALENVPSADRPQKVIAQIKFDEEKLREIVKEAVERFKEEYEITDRPQGEWIDAEIPLESGGSMPIQVCNLCKTFYPLAHTGGGYRFCPNCGAKMKGADDE